MALKTVLYDPKEYLKDPDTHQGAVEDAFESDDEAHIADTVRLIAEVRGLWSLAAEAEVVRDQAMAACVWNDDGWREPQMFDLIRVRRLLEALGYRLTPRPFEARQAA